MNIYHFEWETKVKDGRAMVVADNERQAQYRLCLEYPRVAESHESLRLVKVIPITDPVVIYHHEVIKEKYL